MVRREAGCGAGASWMGMEQRHGFSAGSAPCWRAMLQESNPRERRPPDTVRCWGRRRGTTAAGRYYCVPVFDFAGTVIACRVGWRAKEFWPNPAKKKEEAAMCRRLPTGVCA